MNDGMREFVIEGFLVGGDDEVLQVVMPPYLLALARADVRGVEELPALPQQDVAFCVAARLTLVVGARLRAMHSARDLDSSMWEGRRPFAMATRPPRPPMVGEADYAERERRYFVALGLEEPIP